MTVKILRASVIAPMDRAPIVDGAIAFNDRIIEVGEARVVRARHPDAQVIDAGESIVLPGLVNAHTHLELSAFCQAPGPKSFSHWLLNLVPRSTLTLADIQAMVERGIPAGVEQCLRFGVTTVGDISKQCMFSRPLLRNGPLRVVSYGEVQAMAQRRGLLDERFATATDSSDESESLRVGVSPHAPYTVEPEGYRKCLEFARQANRPIATHLAESPDEASFLEHGTGPFRELWEALNHWDDRVPTYIGGPIRFARDLGLLDYPTLLAHVNYCDDDELDILAGGKASVVYCPRTHLYFGHPPHRWREMLARGINVAVGTDSCASSPDLNLVDDLRLLHEIAPEVPVQTLWEMATTRAARAIGMGDRVGSITSGKSADFAIFEARSLEGILESSRSPREVWIAGHPS
jgi:cytosine/adenosine deaminase-related metal-dependent hydrolase